MGYMSLIYSGCKPSDGLETHTAIGVSYFPVHAYP